MAAQKEIIAQAHIFLYKNQKNPKNKQGQENPENIASGCLLIG